MLICLVSLVSLRYSYTHYEHAVSLVATNKTLTLTHIQTEREKIWNEIGGNYKPKWSNTRMGQTFLRLLNKANIICHYQRLHVNYAFIGVYFPFYSKDVHVHDTAVRLFIRFIPHFEKLRIKTRPTTLKYFLPP